MKPEILTAIIAATAALSGVILSQMISLFQVFLSRRHEKQKLLRQKYEEMMFFFSASLGWLQDLNGSTTQSSVFALAQNPAARKALSLALLYFPHLAESANQYVLAQQSYYNLVVSSFRESIGFTAGGQTIKHNKQQCEIETANLFQKKNEFENLIISNASKYTKA
jgi:hypothetical protein